MLSIQSSRGRMWNQVDKNLGLFVMIVWQLLKWLRVLLLLGLHEALVSCLSYLTLRLCWAFAHSLGTKSFSLERSWYFLISSGLVFAFTWLLGTWMRILCFAFKPSLLGFSVGQCIHQGGDYEHIVEICPCVCDEWLTHVWKVWGFPSWVIFYMCLIMLMANQMCCVELCCVECVVQHVS